MTRGTPSLSDLVSSHLASLPERGEITLDSLMKIGNGRHTRTELEDELRRLRNDGGTVVRIMTGRWFKVGNDQ